MGKDAWDASHWSETKNYVLYPSTDTETANKTKKKIKRKERTSVFYCHGITPGSQIRNSQTVTNFLSD